jgi:hypothetical protein
MFMGVNLLLDVLALMDKHHQAVKSPETLSRGPGV